MPRPRSITDKEINEAAREVFVEKGPSASVSLIAEKLGVSHAALFSRAGSKQQLMMHALSPGRPRAVDWLAEGPPEEEIEERLFEILLDLMTFLHRVIPNLVILKAAGQSIGEPPPDGGPPPPVALRLAMSSWLERAVEAKSIGPIHPTSVAEGLLGAMEARCFNVYLGGSDFAVGEDEEFLRALIVGLLGITKEQQR